MPDQVVFTLQYSSLHDEEGKKINISDSVLDSYEEQEF